MPASDLMLPRPRPALLVSVGEDPLRWACLRLIEELKDGDFGHCLPTSLDDHSDLSVELAEVVVNGLAGDQQRAAAALVRLEARLLPLTLTAIERQVWLNRWASALRRSHLPRAAWHPLWDWMAELTLRWLAGGEPTTPAIPIDLYRRR